MTFTAGSSGHLKAHNDLRAAVLTEAARFGLTPPNLAGPFVGGEPNHIGAHNDVAAAIRAIATAGGIDIDGNFSLLGQTFPDTAHLGDPGHPADHNLLWDAVELLRLSPAWNSATGGTITDVINYNGTGETWRIHTFKSNDTFQVAIAAQPFRVLCVAAGYKGADGGYHGSGGGGRGGNVLDGDHKYAKGAHPVTIGQSNGAATTVGEISSAAGGQGGAGGHGTSYTGSNNAGGAGGAGISCDITGTAKRYAGGGGGACFTSDGDFWGTPIGYGADGGGNGGRGWAAHNENVGQNFGASGGQANTGGGGGGGGGCGDNGTAAGGAGGGSGLAVIAYRIG